MNQNFEKHCADADLIEHLSTGPRPDVAQHVEECAPCWRELGRMQAALRLEAEAVECAMDALPDEFWVHQKYAIVRRARAEADTAALPRQSWLSWMWTPAVAAAAMIVLSLALLLLPQPPTPMAILSEEDELLADVQKSIHGEQQIGGLESIYLLLPEDLDTAPREKEGEKGDKDVKDLG